jgi:hypothetical protein
VSDERQSTPKGLGGEDAADDDLVRFFHALSPAARREYEALALRDRTHGEELGAERRVLLPEKGGKGG